MKIWIKPYNLKFIIYFIFLISNLEIINPKYAKKLLKFLSNKNYNKKSHSLI